MTKTCVHAAERLCRTAAEFYGERAAKADHKHEGDGKEVLH